MEPIVQTTYSPIKVVVAGHDPLVRRGLRSILGDSEKVCIVGESADPEAALHAIQRHDPDILLMTFSFLDDAGLDFISQVRETMACIRVILTGMSVDQTRMLAAIECGAFGFLPSDASSDDFVSAFQQAVTGQSSVMSEIAGDLLLYALMKLNDDHRSPDQLLSTRECEVLQRMAHGMSNKEIGADLHIRLGTVKAHVSNVLRKLGVADRTQAVVKAIREGLVEP